MRYKITELQLSGNDQYATIAKDCNALLDLLNEYCKTNIAMSFTRSYGGRANLRLKRFTIPLTGSHVSCGIDWLLYYVIHEFTHCLGYSSHNETFKTQEQTLCKLFGYELEYKRAYPKAIYCNGQAVYKSK